MKKIGFVLLIMISTNALADDAKNIMACVHKANEYSGVKLSEFEATYEGNIFSMSIARWPNAYCEVKLGDVYNLTVNDNYIIFEEFSGKAAYELNKQLEAKTEVAITQLKSRIVLLEQRRGQVSSDLKLPNPDLVQLTRYVDEGIEKSVGHSQITTQVPNISRMQPVINNASHSSTATDAQSGFSLQTNADDIKLGDYYVSSDELNVRLDASIGGAITNILYKRQKVKVFEFKNGWARVSDYYDGTVEGVSGNVARWVYANHLSSDRPSED